MSGRVLVTGGAGFIGSHIAEAYLDAGWEVVVLDDLSRGHEENVPGGARFMKADIRSPEARRLLAGGNFDLLNHHAAQIDVRVSVDRPAFDADINVLGLVNLLEGAAEGGVRRVVFASSGGVLYGEADILPTPETAPKLPVSPYGVSKLAGELYCAAWTAVQGLSTVSLRYFNVFGPGQHRESKYAAVFPAFIGALLDGRPPEVNWDGEQTRDFTYIDDVVVANLAAAEAGSEASGKAFNIGGGRAKSVNEVLRAVSDALGIWIEPIPTPKRPGDVRHTLADITRAKTLLGWEPKADWQTAVKATVDWFRTQLA